MSKLYLVPTPIGNLEDITLRALKVLKKVNTILAEDTRKTSILLNHYQIDTKIQSHHKFNEHKSVNQIVERIKNGESIALVSDAGTPGVSDPGFLLVKCCIEKNVGVECLPGATAIIPALISSGLPNNKFCFEGFLPQKKGRQKRLQQLVNESRTMVFFESPHRLLKALKQFGEHFGINRKAAISRELSKIHEETVRGTLEELKDFYKDKTIKGEIVIVVEGKKE